MILFHFSTSSDQFETTLTHEQCEIVSSEIEANILNTSDTIVDDIIVPSNTETNTIDLYVVFFYSTRKYGFVVYVYKNLNK